jgi:hypothetical protein
MSSSALVAGATEQLVEVAAESHDPDPGRPHPRRRLRRRGPDPVLELEAAVRGGASTLAHAVGDEPEPGPEHVRMLVERGVSVTPTLAFFYALHRYLDDPTLLDDPFLRAGVTEEAIESSRRAPMFRMEGLTDFMRLRLEGALRHVGEAHRAGVTIALGTDAGNPFTFPGFSAHVEMQLLVEAGLTPMEVIVAATRRGAELLRGADEFGTLEPGKRADLLILGANPLDDIRNTRSLEVVISEGRVVDRQALLARHRARELTLRTRCPAVPGIAPYGAWHPVRERACPDFRSWAGRMWPSSRAWVLARSCSWRFPCNGSRLRDTRSASSSPWRWANGSTGPPS